MQQAPLAHRINYRLAPHTANLKHHRVAVPMPWGSDDVHHRMQPAVYADPDHMNHDDGERPCTPVIDMG